MNLSQYPLGVEKEIEPCDLEQIAKTSSITPLFYWVSRTGDETLLAMGLHKKVTLDQEIQNTIVGASRFVSGPSAKEWETFDDNFFFIPKILLRRKGSNYTVLINCNSELHKLEDLTIDYKYERPFKEKLIPTKNDFLISFNNALNEMKEKEVTKIVLAKKKIYTFKNKVCPWNIFKQTKDLKRNYSFLFKIDNEHCFISFSPEQLVRVEKKQIQCDSMAGTILKNQRDELLTRNEKNRDEQQIVTDVIKDNLSQYCESISNEKTLIIEVSSQLKHLYTKINGQLKDTLSPKQILNILHPTPAVGGTPWPAAKKIIENNEHFDRGLYAGPCGIIEKSRMEFLVGIRCSLIEHNKLHLFAGAGITKSSQGEQEWDEMENKMKQFSQQI